MDNCAFKRLTREIQDDTKDLILKMLHKNPDRRISPEMALKHPYFVKNGFVKNKEQENYQSFLVN